MTRQRNSTNALSFIPAADPLEATESLQLSKLSSVLNGLEGGAQLIHRHIQETMRTIRAGTYRIDPLQLSHRIIREALRVM